MAPRSRRSSWPLAVTTALGLALSPTGDAAARKFQMSGTWIYRTGAVFLPLQFAAAGMDMTGHRINASMGNLTGATGFPNGPIPGAGGVTATGSAPATLRIPPHRFVEDAMTLIVASGISETILTDFGVDAPYAAATLARVAAPEASPGARATRRASRRAACARRTRRRAQAATAA